jgi:hypothetical protein
MTAGEARADGAQFPPRLRGRPRVFDQPKGEPGDGFQTGRVFPRPHGLRRLRGRRGRSDDGVKEHHFIRADLHANKDDADACAVMKGKRIVDEQGDRMFESR